MSDQAPADVLEPELPGLEVLCRFHFCGHECFLVVSPGSERAPACHASYVTVCHFQVDGRSLAIIHKNRCNANRRAGDELAALLTARELQIATLVAMGCPNKQVADRLHISEWTVATYLRRIFAKLGVDSRAAMTFRCASLIGRQPIQAPSRQRPRL